MAALEEKKSRSDTAYADNVENADRESETTLTSVPSTLGTPSELEVRKYKDKEGGRDEYELEEDNLSEEKPMKWTNIIFLPFENWWQLIILLCVFMKGLFAPLAAVYPQIRCPADETVGSITEFMVFFYMNFADPLYIIDTFMYILHRQVTDAAMKREHLPKAAWMIFLDIFGLIPFYVLFAGEYCHSKVRLWPNVAQYSELLITYRIGQYFSLSSTHSYWQLSIGYLLYFVLIINALTTLLLVLTKHGLCRKCHEGIYDWRAYNYEKITKYGDVGEYVYAASLVASLLVHRMSDETVPSTYMEFAIVDILILVGYMLSVYIVLPKLFSENIYHFSRIYYYQPRVDQILTQLKSRDLKDDYTAVETFYSVIWNKQHGISKVPHIIFQLPKNLQTDLMLDLTWMVFFHSPNLRNSSVVFKRWLSAHVEMSYKLPDESFFRGSQCFSKLYYLKSGIVQINSSDDTNAAVLSVSDGTLFGDVNFLLPIPDKKLFARCLTYCEIFSISRENILKALLKFPDDRRQVFKLTKDRLKHAHQLYERKKQVKVEDRSEEEGIAWLKKRWWDVFELISAWKITSTKKSCKIPAEEVTFHCPKYIGQLVPCKDIILRKSSLFIRLQFPYILTANSALVNIWHKLVKVTVFLVLICFPPTLARVECGDEPEWFGEFSFGVDIIFVTDVIFFMLTAKEDEEVTYSSMLGSVFDRCKDMRFFMDILSTPLMDIFFISESLQAYKTLGRYNRLIKTHILFHNLYKKVWSHNQQYESYFVMALFSTVMMYIPPFIILVVSLTTSSLTLNTFFYDSEHADECITNDNRQCARHIVTEHGISQMFENWIGKIILLCHGIIYNTETGTLYDVTLTSFLTIFNIVVCMYLRSKSISIMFLINQPTEDFEYLISKIANFSSHWRLHPDLMKRLSRYFHVHWKYQRGIHFLNSNLLKDEPNEIYWKVYGQVAEKVLAESYAFNGADPLFIKKLVPKSKFMIIPKKGNILAFGMLSEHLTFLVRGVVICEYQDENNDIRKKILSDGTTAMGLTTVFFKQPVMKSYTAITDTELLCISRADLLQVLHHFPKEKEYFQTCIKEMGSDFDAVFKKEVLRQKEYETLVRSRIFHNKMITDEEPKSTEKKTCWTRINCIPFIRRTVKEFRTNPESRFILVWMVIRAIATSTILICGTLRGLYFAPWPWYLYPIERFCTVLTTFDIIMKFFLPYYDKDRGIPITSIPKCAIHYLTRGFCVDFFSWVCQFPTLIGYIIGGAKEESTKILIRLLGKSCTTYLVSGLFNYYANSPSVNSSLIMLVKWHVMMLFVFLLANRYFVWECIEPRFDANSNVRFEFFNTSCWMPSYFKLDMDKDGYLTFHEYYLVCAQSWSLTQCAFYVSFNGQNHMQEERGRFTIIFCLLALFFWYQMCICQANLIYRFQGDQLVRQSISQLRRFLKSERIDDGVIKRAVEYCNYWCRRTEGINQQFYVEKTSIVLRQDFYYYFYKRTLKGTNTIFQSSESSMRQLAGLVDMRYFLPNDDIIREMDLCNAVYIVHRGKAVVQQKGKKLATLTKGCIFGLLNSKVTRPSTVTVQAEEHTDLLYIPAENFQAILSNDIRRKIAESITIKYNFIALDRPMPENPYNTVKYNLTPRRAIKLPKMKETVTTDESAWYRRWLFWSWIVCPVFSAVFVAFYVSMPHGSSYIIKIMWSIIDFSYGILMISECYTMKLTVVGSKCEYKRIGWSNLTQWWYIIQWLTIILPLMRFIDFGINVWWLHFARLGRLYVMKMYWKEFYSDYGGKKVSKLLKALLLLAFLHIIASGWTLLTCRSFFGPRHFPETNYAYIPDNMKFVDFSQWTLPNTRHEGCARTARSYNVTGLARRTRNFYVPKHWYLDYLISFSYIMIILTRLNMDAVLPVDLVGIYYKVIVAHILYLSRLYVCSYAISSIYVQYREMYQFDYNISELLEYMTTNGVSSFLTHAVEVYSKMLWKRHRGSQLPEIADNMPICLREDVFDSLYMYHLQTPILFQCLPQYFLRQMVVRLKRNFVFPGKYIVLEGDIHSCLYFIHEGEVEKWYTDHNGESRMASVLTTNGYFGILPGLFPNIPYQFSYYSRTIVDIVSLTHSDWQDLLDGFPDIRNKLYSLASRMKTQKSYADKKI